MPVAGLSKIAGGASGKLTYSELQTKYYDFSHPRAAVVIGGKAFASEGDSVILGEVHVEITSGFEASVASFRLYDVFDASSGKFRYEKVKKQVVMGNSVTISLGYSQNLETVFVGFISGVIFGYELGGLPYIEVTAMDIKGIMMGGTYATQIKATNYGSAVKEILARTGEGKLQQMGGIIETPSITPTPDADSIGMAGGKSSPYSIEMVSESDYEFVVRAAKRYNYEFFVDRGKVLFRPAKNDTSTLMELGVRKGIQTFNIEYSITGVVGKIEARAMDPGNGKVISASSKFNNKISTANKAKQLMGSGSKVYLDASISSAEEAEARVKSLMEQMSYRLGSLEANCIGIPDLVPGRFIEVKGLGVPVDNKFYVTSVNHDFTGDSGFMTMVRGCTDHMQTTESSLSGI